jgi:ribosomal protein S18 acetylase RimI-like enzyme
MQLNAGTAIMQKHFETAEEKGCTEVWLVRKVEHKAANALYRSPNPDDVSQVVGYTYETDE